MNYPEFCENTRNKNLKPVGRSYIDRTLHEIAKLWDSAIFGVRPRLNPLLGPRLRIIIVIALLIAISFAKTLSTLILIASIVFLGIAFAILRKTFTLRAFLGGGFGFAFVFALFMAAPAAINIFSHVNGSVIVPMYTCSKSHYFGPIQMPAVIGVTREGLASSLFLFIRVLTSVAVALWLTLSLRWLDLLRALRSLGVPPVVLQISAMTVIYLHLLLKRTEEVHLARKSRVICRERTVMGQKWVGSRIARAWEDSLRLMEDVRQAMMARGFRGEAKFGSKS